MGCNISWSSIVIELCKMVDVVGLKPLNNISFLKVKCYLC